MTRIAYLVLCIFITSCFDPKGAMTAGPQETGTTSTSGESDGQTTSEGATTGIGPTGTGSTGTGPTSTVTGATTFVTTATETSSSTTMPPAMCGNAIVEFREPCDDGNLVDDDACSNDCVLARRAFVTGATYIGSFGSISAADTICAAEAEAAGIGQPGAKWLAWLADTQTAPAMRFDTTFDGWYRMTTDLALAKGWQGLTNGSLLHSLSVDASGIEVAGIFAWTNVGSDGMPFDAVCCGDWTYQSEMTSGRVGILTDPAQWTTNIIKPCNTQAHIYCFEQ